VALGPQLPHRAARAFDGHTAAGGNNAFHSGCVSASARSDLEIRGEPTRLRNWRPQYFREHVTVHRSNNEAEERLSDSHNFLMAHCHVGHNARMADHVIVANGAFARGHVLVQDRAFVSAIAWWHQFVRVGTLALMQGGAAISKDLPPFCVARGDMEFAD